ncbi:unnamed protein product [Diplocarpon coronariae]|uniref:Erythromycin esterase n=1 Tax=Diplocarpon coronariae TaxID=2795749 RepID=A0A218YTA3_9HELO|nr:hypothetical protein B2J93_2216 [Marssonina coronariae]
MPPPRRRSSRLRGSSATPGKSFNNASNRLESLAERDETPATSPQSKLDAVVSSPLAPRTPATAGRIKPALAEMHPSKVQQSTTHVPDSGLRLGFTDIEAKGNSNQPSGLTQQTPSKIGISPSFDFRFAHPAPQLGPEAQRMMDELREEALRIKVKLAAEREEEKRKDEKSGEAGGRKIAQPKGKVGRFSDVHMAEFKKMDSIAGHPSSFRAQPGRFAPATTSLKRTQSKAQLDEREVIQNNLKRTQSKAQLHERDDAANKNEKSERLDNTAPAKRARTHVSEDTSSARPVSSHENKTSTSTPNMSRSHSTMLSAAITPTQASLARAASTKKTQIPSLSRSSSRPNLTGTPRGLTKSATTNNLSSAPTQESQSFMQSPVKFNRVKSIFGYPSSSANKPATKPAVKSATISAAKPIAVPSLSRSPSRPNLEKSLPSIPVTPGAGGGSKTIKHVNFTPDVVSKINVAAQNSPSPMKSGIPRSASKINFGPRSSVRPVGCADVEATEVEYPSIVGASNLDDTSKIVVYPSLSGVRPLPEPPRKAHPSSNPGSFTFRSDHTINFGASPKGFGSSPGQSSVRQVRQSVLPSTMPGSFPTGNKENKAPLPSVPHGMANKKRRRVESDDEAEEDERSPKKHKAVVAEGHLLVAPNLPATPNPTVPSPVKKRGVLSLSRLNMLSRPKNRK